MVGLVVALGLGFAQYLVQQGEPALAILELQRELDLQPGDAAARSLLFKLYLGHHRLAEAHGVATTALERAALAEAEGHFQEAFQGYRGASKEALTGFALRRRWWSLAEETAGELGDAPLAAGIAAWRTRERPGADRAKLLAAALPGAGQLYAGEPAAAAGALGVNGVIVGAAAWAALRQDWVGAATIVGYGSRYYFGGILHAGAYVEARNEREDAAFVAGLAASRPWLRGPAMMPGSEEGASP